MSKVKIEGGILTQRTGPVDIYSVTLQMGPGRSRALRRVLPGDVGVAPKAFLAVKYDRAGTEMLLTVLRYGVVDDHLSAALEELVSKRQFVTTRSCLRWDSPLETRMPLRCVHFPWHYGVICIAAAAGYLLKLELNYYATIDTSTSSGYWETFLGLGRDMLFIAALGEVMVFYKAAVAHIRRSLN